MESGIVEMVHKRGLEKSVVYSAFYAKSLEKLKTLDADAELGILDSKASDCMYKIKGGCGASALHPCQGIYIRKSQLEADLTLGRSRRGG